MLEGRGPITSSLCTLHRAQDTDQPFQCIFYDTHVLVAFPILPQRSREEGDKVEDLLKPREQCG